MKRPSKASLRARYHRHEAELLTFVSLAAGVVTYCLAGPIWSLEVASASFALCYLVAKFTPRNSPEGLARAHPRVLATLDQLCARAGLGRVHAYSDPELGQTRYTQIAVRIAPGRQRRHPSMGNDSPLFDEDDEVFDAADEESFDEDSLDRESFMDFFNGGASSPEDLRDFLAGIFGAPQVVDVVESFSSQITRQKGRVSFRFSDGLESLEDNTLLFVARELSNEIGWVRWTKEIIGGLGLATGLVLNMVLADPLRIYALAGTLVFFAGIVYPTVARRAVLRADITAVKLCQPWGLLALSLMLASDKAARQPTPFYKRLASTTPTRRARTTALTQKMDAKERLTFLKILASLD